jgi:energy-coupling factor transport system permease protein
MMPNVAYLPGDTPLHHLDARVKLALLTAYTFLLFASTGWEGLACCLLLAVFGLVTGKVPVRLALRGAAPIVFLLGFTVMANALSLASPADGVMIVGSLEFTLVGMLHGIYLATRIVLLIIASALLSLTTTPVALMDAFTSLLRPLRRWNVPVGDIAMMCSIALRFIPVVANEADRIATAQRARGARFGEGGPIVRVRAWVPVLVPLLVSLFHRADKLADMLDGRCFTGALRTRLDAPRMRRVDWIVLFGGCMASLLLSIYL